MDGTLAQLVALTCHANAAIAGRSIPTFFPQNTTCMFCESITFTASGPSGAPALVADRPDAWFARLKQQGAVGLRLAMTPQGNPQIPDRMSAGMIGGGGDWSIAVMDPAGSSDVWVAQWTVWNRNAPDNRIWRVRYHRVGSIPTLHAPAPDLTAITDALRNALERIHAFATRENCGNFPIVFKAALDCLADPSTCKSHYRDLTIDGAMPPAEQLLLRAAQGCWVFGGMGSWNDMSFQGAVQAEYDTVSSELFEALRTAIVAGANGSLPPSS